MTLIKSHTNDYADIRYDAVSRALCRRAVLCAANKSV